VNHQQYHVTAAYIKERIAPLQPQIGLVLGSGLGGFVDQLENPIVIPFAEIPNWLQTTVHGHRGRLILGQIEGRWILVQQGRSHFYEGYSAQEITFPIRVMHFLGIRTVILTNAAGGVNPSYSAGDMMVLNDHLYFAGLAGHNPLIGPNDDSLGPRFVGMVQSYDKSYRLMAEQVARDQQIPCHQGVYVAVTGPNLETRAEYRFLRLIGADVVGMSTVPEVIVAVHCGLKTVGFSIITDMCLPDALEPANVEDIIATAKEAEKKLRVLVEKLVASL